MPSHWVKFTLIFIIASGLLLTGFFLAWYPHSVIESIEARLNQGGLTQSEIGNLQGSLLWWRGQGIFNYGSASNFVIALGILVLVYAIVYSLLFTWRESMRDKQINANRQEISQVKHEEKLIDNFQYEKTRKTGRISFPLVGGLFTIVASWIVMFFSGILVFSTQSTNYLVDGVFGILVSVFALTGGIMILKRKRFVFSIIAACLIGIKGATFIILTGGNFWSLFVGMETLTLTIISLIFTSISKKEFS